MRYSLTTSAALARSPGSEVSSIMKPAVRRVRGSVFWPLRLALRRSRACWRSIASGGLRAMIRRAGMPSRAWPIRT